MTFDDEDVVEKRKKAIEWAMQNPPEFNSKKKPTKKVRVSIDGEPESTNALKDLSSMTVTKQGFQKFYLDGE